MIVSNLDVMSVALAPSKTDPPLIVDADAIFARSLAGQLLRSVAWRTAKVFQRLGSIQDQQLPERSPLQLGGPPANGLPFEDLLGVLVPEALDHAES
jgi:hypothetical protein